VQDHAPHLGYFLAFKFLQNCKQLREVRTQHTHSWDRSEQKPIKI